MYARTDDMLCFFHTYGRINRVFVCMIIVQTWQQWSSAASAAVGAGAGRVYRHWGAAGALREGEGRLKEALPRPDAWRECADAGQLADNTKKNYAKFVKYSKTSSVCFFISKELIRICFVNFILGTFLFSSIRSLLQSIFFMCISTTPEHFSQLFCLSGNYQKYVFVAIQVHC